MSNEISASLVLEDGTIFSGTSFGYNRPVSGEVVFTTGMVGYPESMTDPSYEGQILVFTFPLIGNYGVPGKKSSNGILNHFESDKIHTKAIIVAEYSKRYSHWEASKSLSEWLNEEKIPGISGIDTRALTKKLRENGTMLGKIVFSDDNHDKISFDDPNKRDLVGEVSVEKPVVYGDGNSVLRIVLVDCGCKNNIIRSFILRGVQVVKVPYEYNFLNEKFDGLFISNGPGDPKMCRKTIENVRETMDTAKPIFGICLGNQILALAAGGDTYKLRYGHRSQNQPCVDKNTKRCYITSQNHGFAVDEKSLPAGWEEWFVNANDGTNEGIRHKRKPFMGCQFHPEFSPGPTDTEFLFDKFIEIMRKYKK